MAEIQLKTMKFPGIEDTYTIPSTPEDIGAAAAGHTHSYAGSASAGGAATSANKLNTNAGDSNTPVYFSGGVPKACTSLDLNTTGSAAKLTTARTIQTDLGSTSSASFNGSANITPGVTGTLSLTHGGTNATTAQEAFINLSGRGTRNGDFNTLKEPGCSWAQLGDCTNTPYGDNRSGIFGFLEVMRTSSASELIIQKFTNYADLACFVRCHVNGAWGSWVPASFGRNSDVSNKNLLDNWYFPNAVNQRGAAVYRSEGFTVDRWKLSLWPSSTTGAYAYPNKSDLTLHSETAQGTACSCYLEQTLENPSKLAGKTVTLSAKLRNTTTVAGDPILRIYTDKGVYKSDYIRTSDAGKIVTLTTTLPANITALSVGIGAYASYGGDGNFNLAIESMKLEVGSISTLANDTPPKYSEQLLECQRYYIRFASDGGQWLMGASNGTTLYAPLHLPVPMRVSPTFGYSNVNIYPYVSSGKVEITKLELVGASGTQDFMLYAHHASNALEAKQPGCIRFTSSGYIELSAEIASQGG